MSLVPPSFLFRFTFAIPRQDKLPRTRPPLLKLPASAKIAFPSAVDGANLFATLAAGWNRDGIGFTAEVSGKSSPPVADPDRPTNGDCLRLWLDTRDTQTIHRASRFCHQFCLLPVGGGEDGTEPLARQLPVPRAREDAPEVDTDNILLQSEIREEGYRLDAWFPADTLNGFDPETQTRLGFFCQFRDADLGVQSLGLNEGFPYDADPSLWSSLELAD